MRAWLVALILPVALGCTKRLPDLAETREVRDGELVARVGGPLEAVGGAKLISITNAGKKAFDTRLGECTFTHIAPGERRACAARFGGDPKGIHLTESTGPITDLRLKETTIRSAGPGQYEFHAVVVNDSWKPRRVLVSFLAATKSGHLVGGHSDVAPAKNILESGEESVVDVAFSVTTETPADTPLVVAEGIAKGQAAIGATKEKIATLSAFHSQTSGGATQRVGTLTNVGTRLMYPSAFLYFQDKRGRTIGNGTCRDVPRLDANAALAPSESLTCLLLPGASVPASWDRIEVDAGPYMFDATTLRPIATDAVRAASGVLSTRLRNTTSDTVQQTIVYVRAQPDWWKAELLSKPIPPGETIPFETSVPGAVSAEVAAYAVITAVR